MSDADPGAVPSFAVGSQSARQGYNRDRFIITPVCGFAGLLTNAAATLYTGPSGSISGSTTQKARLTEIVLSNTDASARTVTLYLIAAAGSAGTSNTLLPTVSVPANTMWRLEMNTILKSGDFIQGLASVTNVVVCRLSLEEMT